MSSCFLGLLVDRFHVATRPGGSWNISPTSPDISAYRGPIRNMSIFTSELSVPRQSVHCHLPIDIQHIVARYVTCQYLTVYGLFHLWNRKPGLACVNVQHPPSKNHVGVLSWTCRSQRKMTEQIDWREKEPSQVACVSENLKC